MKNSDFHLVEHVHCETAGEFVDALSPTGPYFRRFSPVESWIFRGHGDDNYKLSPSALRNESTVVLHQLARSGQIVAENSHLNICQWLTEALLVRDFFLLADSSGLQLPEDSQVLRASLKRTVELLQGYAKPIIEKTWEAIPTSMVWPPTELLSLIALAQHYGLPTRLLDWSRSALIAGYFAASGACRIKSRYFGVWALLATELSVGHILRGSTGKAGTQLQLITAPRAANPNLNAQDGLFTMCVSINESPLADVDRRSIDELLSDCDNPFKSYSPLLFHFSAPSTEANKVLWYLDKYSVNAAKLFPSFEGAVMAIRERDFQSPPSGEN